MDLETYTPDNLIAGNFPLADGEVTILTGQNLAAGALLGKVTASGKYIQCDSAAVDGSQAPQCILAEAADATAADVVAPVYLTGEFNEDAVAYGGADDADTHRDALRDLSIFLKKAVSA